ncbi:response regulator [Hymenobacter perfusus]|uniref:DNA-binding response regulator n=1 Tax=Hymenobacter perfusus TaxID=1236770 RepID=A0A428JZ44_9BACT|nr:response regulator [Hymenobacter perfusus]RSK39449.1 DNA-binding response regulator [Hymenobacter perfusus]
MKSIVAIIEAEPAVREVWQAYLGAQPEFESVVVAESVEELVATLLAGARKPHLILLDARLPRAAALADIALLREFAALAAVVLMVEESAGLSGRAGGANGYLLKNTPLPTIKEGLLEVLFSVSALPVVVPVPSVYAF